MEPETTAKHVQINSHRTTSASESRESRERHTHCFPSIRTSTTNTPDKKKNRTWVPFHFPFCTIEYRFLHVARLASSRAVLSSSLSLSLRVFVRQTCSMFRQLSLPLPRGATFPRDTFIPFIGEKCPPAFRARWKQQILATGATYGPTQCSA